MQSVAKFLVAAVMAAFFTTAAAAAKHGPCKEDVQKLCKDVQPGEGRIMACLKEHEAEVSPKCAGNIKQAQQAMKQLSAACEADVEKYCFDTPIGKGGIASCLKKHAADLSPDCKAAVSKAKAGAAEKSK